MNFKTTIFLLTLLIVVGGSYFYMESHAPKMAPARPYENDGRLQRPGTAIFSTDDFPTKSVRSIVIETSGETIELTQEETGWQQTSPVRFALKQWKANQLRDDAAGLRHAAKHRLGSKEAPTMESAGLAPAGAVVTFHFDTEGTRNRIIKVGGKLPLGGRGFVMIDDDPHIYVVEDALHKTLLDDKITDLRKTSLDSPSEGKARHIKLDREGQTIELIKSNDQWALGLPHSGRADAEAIQSLLRDTGNLSIKEFVDDNPQNRPMYGLETPQTVLTIQSAGKTNKENGEDEVEAKSSQPVEVRILRIGAANFQNENFFTTWSESSELSPVVFTISKSDKEKFDKTLDELRDPRLTPIARSDVREIGIEQSGGGGFKLLYREGSWSFDDPHPGFEADTDRVSELVDAIVDARAKAFQANARTDKKPSATIMIAAIGRTEPDVLKVFALDDNQRHLVLRNNENTGYEVDELKLVFESVLKLRDRNLYDLDHDQLNRLTIERPDGIEFRFERVAEVPVKEPEADLATEVDPATESGEWQLAGAEKFESEALENLLDRLLPLRVERWHPERSLIETGFTIELTARNGDRARFLIDPTTRALGRWQKGDGAATLSIEGAEVQQDLIDALDAEFRYRTVLNFQAQDIAAVAITRNGKTVLIGKDKDDYVGSGNTKIDQSAAGGLFDTLAGLRIERFQDERDVPESDLIRLRIDRKEGDSIELTIHPDRNIGYLAPSNWFKLDKDKVAKLTVDLVEAE